MSDVTTTPDARPEAEYVRDPANGAWITPAELEARGAADPVTATLDAATAADMGGTDGIPDFLLSAEELDAREAKGADAIDALLGLNTEQDDAAAYPTVRRIEASIAPGEVRNGDDHFGPPVEDPLPLSAEYRRLAGHVLATRAARDAKREERRKANAQHASDDAARAGLVKQAKEYVSLAEEALGEFVRANGTGDPDRILRGTGQRITKRGGADE